METRTRRRLFALGLIGLGSAISCYLLLRFFALQADPTIQGTGFCSTVLKMNCDASLLSTTSKQFGIPMAGWGVVYYATLASLLILGHLLRSSFDSHVTLGAVILTSAGALVSIALAVIIAAGRAPFCPLCMAIHAINVCLLLAVWRLAGRTAPQILQSLTEAGRYLLGRPARFAPEAQWTCVGFLATALIAVAFYQCILFQTEKRAAPGVTPTQILVSYAFAAPEEIPIYADDPQLGGGPVQLVMFSSFECPACKIVSKYLRELATDEFAGQLNIVFKHFPLGKACNPALKQEMYPHACAAARAAEAAKRQDAFWPFYEAIQVTDLSEPNDPLVRAAREVGLALPQFDELRKAEATESKIQRDIALGQHLGVTGTPTIFVNGRKLKYMNLPAIELILSAVVNAPQIQVEATHHPRIENLVASQ